MFRWSKQAVVCYAFLSDVDFDPPGESPWLDMGLYSADWEAFCPSEWFRRGWTLQELIAPRHMLFFNRYWRLLGDRSALAPLIEHATGVQTRILHYGYEKQLCVADIMSWAAGRSTTRIEDRAYSLLGLFGISMPLLYGEGHQAFIRLQEEILRRSDDQSIFAWSGSQVTSRDDISPQLLAISPDLFSKTSTSYVYNSPATFPRRAAHSITNEGISLQLELVPVKPRVYLALLNSIVHEVSDGQETFTPEVLRASPSIYLKRIDETRYARWGIEVTRNRLNMQLVEPLNISSQKPSQLRQVTVVNTLKQHELRALLQDQALGFKFSKLAYTKNECGIAVNLPTTSTSTIIVPKKTNTSPNPACLVELKPYGRKANIPYIRVDSLGFRFDFDFSPVCVLKIDQGLHTALDRVVFQSAQYTSDPFPSGPELSIDVSNGEWKNESRDYIAIRPTVESLFSGTGVFATISSRYSGRAGGMVDVRIYETDSLDKVWQVMIKTHVL